MALHYLSSIENNGLHIPYLKYTSLHISEYVAIYTFVFLTNHLKLFTTNPKFRSKCSFDNFFSIREEKVIAFAENLTLNYKVFLVWK